MTAPTTFWAVRVVADGKFAYWVPTGDSKDSRLEYRCVEDAWIDVWHFRKTASRYATSKVYRVRRITRRPRLSPEAVAARDALCAAAVAWAGSGTSVSCMSLNVAAIGYAKAVRK